MLPKLIIVVIILGLGFFGVGQIKQETNDEKGEKIFYQKIPGSKFHSPDASWWGYNQTKIVRFNNIVFTYVVENTDDSNKTSSPLVIYKKQGEKSWERGASFITSRPGNILVDSKGGLHVFVFEPFEVSKNDSWGKLKHYTFLNAKNGDIINYQEETVIDNDGTNETVNIRVGAAVGADDTMAIGFGLTTFNPQYIGHSEHLYFKKPDDEKWTHLIAGENLGHDFYYPFVWVEKDQFHLLPVQDDYNGPGTAKLPYPNIYQKIMYLNYSQGKWEKELVADLSNHQMAKSRPRLLEQEDLLVDKNGGVHIIYKEFLDPNNTFTTTSHLHLSGKKGSWKSEKINLENVGANWIRLIEVDGSLFYIITTFDQLLISPVENMKISKIDLPDDANGMYPYLSSKKGGSTESEFVDVLLLGADQKSYQQGSQTNYYVRIPKSRFRR